MASDIVENISRVRAAIAAACDRAGRIPDSVTLVAVSKGKPVELMATAVQAGVQHFGENRVEESSIKIPALVDRLPDLPPLTWHMIGHVQSRKAKEVAPLFDTIHSLDSIRLAEKFSRLAVEQGRVLNVLIQVNISGEASKEGFDGVGWNNEADVRNALEVTARVVSGLPGLQLRGLMTIAPYVPDAETVRPVFRDLRRLRDAMQEALGLPLPELSMGMTDDFPVAIEEGATLVRVGRAIFGER